MDSAVSDLLYIPLLTVTCGAITHHAWVHRVSFLPACRSSFMWVAFNTPSWQWTHGARGCRLETSLDDLRSKHICAVTSVASHIFILCLTFLLATTSHEEGPERFISQGVFNIVSYVACRSVCSGFLPLASRRIDGLFALYHLLLLYRAASMKDDPAYFLFGPQRALCRVILAVLYMDVRKTLLWNIILSLTMCWTCADNLNVFQLSGDLTAQQLKSRVFFAEVMVCMCVTLACACARWICITCLTAKFDAEDAQDAVQHLLAGLCDAVVRISASGKVVKSTEHFRHLLRATSDDELQDTFFSQCLDSESDRTRFESTMVEADTQSLTTVLNVSMRCFSGQPVPVQLLFANLGGTRGQSDYLVGMRSMANMLRETEIDTPGPHGVIATAMSAAANIASASANDTDSETTFALSTSTQAKNGRILSADFRDTFCKGTQTVTPKRLMRPPRAEQLHHVDLNVRKRFNKKFKETPKETIDQILLQAAILLNPQGRGCCFKHIGLVTLHRHISQLVMGICDTEFKPNIGWQCVTCCAVNSDGEDDDDDDDESVCPVCRWPAEREALASAHELEVAESSPALADDDRAGDDPSDSSATSSK